MQARNRNTNDQHLTMIRNQNLILSDSLHIPVNDIVGQQIAVFGIPGSGKTNFGALFCEQLSPFLVPMAIFDREGDLLSLVDVMPRGVLATADNCPSGHDILNQGLQVVYDLASWGSDSMAADLIVSIVGGLIEWANKHKNRVPCLIMLDEANYWLPERRGGVALDKETYKQLHDAFTNVSSTGRKRGLTPCYLCPRISDLSKSVLSPGVGVFMKATLDTDLSRYLEYVSSADLTASQLKRRIAAFGRGRAIVTLPGGRQRTVSFHSRVSEHISHTPGVEAALDRYSTMPVPPRTYKPFATQPEEATQPVPLVKKTSIRQKAKRHTFKQVVALKKKLKKLIKEDSTLSNAKLAESLSVTRQTIYSWRKELGV